MKKAFFILILLISVVSISLNYGRFIELAESDDYEIRSINETFYQSDNFLINAFLAPARLVYSTTQPGEFGEKDISDIGYILGTLLAIFFIISLIRWIGSLDERKQRKWHLAVIIQTSYWLLVLAWDVYQWSQGKLLIEII